jgi:peroxiredoxin
VASIPAVHALERRYGTRGLRVIGVTRDDEHAQIAAAAREHGMSYPGYLDADGSWSRTANLSAIPAFVLIDKSGRLAYRHMGSLREGTDAFERLANVVEQALAR